jgi:G:T-mismatch repair DNA endonuclease (very short patch repair protein)
MHWLKDGAGDRDRTDDIQLGKLNGDLGSRDAAPIVALRTAGWRVLVIWGAEVTADGRKAVS